LFGVTTDYLLYDDYEGEANSTSATAKEESHDTVSDIDAVNTANDEKKDESLSDNNDTASIDDDGKADEISTARDCHNDSLGLRIKQYMQYLKKPAFWIFAVIIVVAICICILLTMQFRSPSDNAGKDTSIVHDSAAEDAPSLPAPTGTLPELSSDILSLVITYANRTATHFTLLVDERVTLMARIEPVRSEYLVKWSSSDENVFSVVTDDASGINVTIIGVSNGSATLTASTGDVQAECTVTVNNQ